MINFETPKTSQQSGITAVAQQHSKSQGLVLSDYRKKINQPAMAPVVQRITDGEIADHHAEILHILQQSGATLKIQEPAKCFDAAMTILTQKAKTDRATHMAKASYARQAWHWWGSASTRSTSERAPDLRVPTQITGRNLSRPGSVYGGDGFHSIASLGILNPTAEPGEQISVVLDPDHTAIRALAARVLPEASRDAQRIAISAAQRLVALADEKHVELDALTPEDIKRVDGIWAMIELKATHELAAAVKGISAAASMPTGDGTIPTDTQQPFPVFTQYRSAALPNLQSKWIYQRLWDAAARGCARCLSRKPQSRSEHDWV